MPVTVPRAAAAALFLYCLLFFGLSGVGLLGPDEPRYASIGRNMAASGDWVTPVLWGEPWFEKPALLYWMIAAATRLGLSGEWAARGPVALASLAFLLFYQRFLFREFGSAAAWCATLILATSAGWISFSHLAVPDLPMTAAFSAAMLLAMPWATRDDRRGLAWAGALMGVAVLAKGLLPLALAAPAVWMGRKRLGALPVPLLAMLAVAAPWYVLCALRNGRPFLDEFFWKHHFLRAATDALQHVQPFWYYVPVLLAALLPWTPLFALFRGSQVYDDPRRRFLLAWFVCGFVFFSAVPNKLPGYLLPLIPAVAALGGICLAEVRDARWLLASAAVLLAVVPPAAEILPPALVSGLSRTGLSVSGWIYLPLAAAVAGVVWRWEARGRRWIALGTLAVSVTAGVMFLKLRAFPRLDERVSARSVWRSVARDPEAVCIEEAGRALRYGLNYYSVKPLPDCEEESRPLRLRHAAGEAAYFSRQGSPARQ